MRNCVIHRRFVYASAIDKRNTLQERNLAFQAYFDIEELIRKDLSVILLDTGDPASVTQFFKSGEEVILYGAYREGCLKTAKEALQLKGIKAEYHPTGSIPMFPIFPISS